MDTNTLAAAVRAGEIPIGDVVARANEIRRRLDAEEEAFKERMKKPKTYLAALANLIHEYLNAQNIQNITGSDGSLAFRHRKESVSVADWDVAWADMVATQRWHFLNHAVNKTEVVAYVKENGVPPPGVNYTVTEEIQFRQPRKKQGASDGQENPDEE